MNVRDPFALRRSQAVDILRGPARQVATEFTEKVIKASTQAFETGKQAVEQAVEEMSFSIPQNVPSFTNPQREVENRMWASSGMTARTSATHSNGVMGGIFEKRNQDLPMYKDKPYSYMSSRRPRPWWKRKSTGAIALLALFILYLLGAFSSNAKETQKAKSRWNWLQRPESGGHQVDWLDRRERVKEAFILSWDAYHRYAWGKQQLHLSFWLPRNSRAQIGQ